MESELDRIGAWGEPILAVLDSWGNAPVPHHLIKRLADNPASEVIVTLLPEHFVRFVSTYGPAIDDVFGGSTSWRSVKDLSTGPAKRRFLLDQYRKMLQHSGFQYVVDFEMVDATGTELYPRLRHDTPARTAENERGSLASRPQLRRPVPATRETNRTRPCSFSRNPNELLYGGCYTLNCSMEMIHRIQVEQLAILRAELDKDLSPEERLGVLAAVRDVYLSALLKDTENKKFLAEQFDKRLAGTLTAALIVAAVVLSAAKSGSKPAFSMSRVLAA